MTTTSAPSVRERTRAKSRVLLEALPYFREHAGKAVAEKSASAYWTDFRGPHRDGRYDQTPIRTEWPDKGLPLLWRQLLSNILFGPFLLILFTAIHHRLKRPKRLSRRRHASAITFQAE